MDKPKRIFSINNIITGVVALAVLALVIMIVRVIEQNYDSETYIRQSKLQNEIQEIENENLALQQEYYKSAEFLELSARMANKALPGENLVILPEFDDQKVKTGLASPPKDERSNFEKWLEFLFGKH